VPRLFVKIQSTATLYEAAAACTMRLGPCQGASERPSRVRPAGAISFTRANSAGAIGRASVISSSSQNPSMPSGSAGPNEIFGRGECPAVNASGQRAMRKSRMSRRMVSRCEMKRSGPRFAKLMRYRHGSS